ncbi:hypothetical protein C8F04DRAFT_599066 [Mycena alexandri]|uniref:Uncharacterized protein n=1 Tax=Mycena alexandri TaxID=1745969 RepID=A0AAD6TFR6_9AGAR|nr:hypothetical protein C8F04DRAFT_599066 [Mycena alexandri]
MFLRARQLWDMYTHLQTRLLHPALPESGPDYSVIKHALADFRSCRRLLVQTGGQKKPIDIDHLQERLEFANNMADTFIRRYKFIRTLMAANRITPDPPWETDNGWVRYGWKCGTPAGSVRVDSEPSRSDDTSQEIFELEWSSPPIQGTMRRSQRDMTFFSTPRGRDPGGPPTKNAGGFRGFFNRAKKETGEGTFTFYLWNHEPVYIVGWSILGYCQGEPRMPKVAHKFHNILSDKLTITVDTTRVTDRWVCRVAFVKQSSYNFPHLELSGRG